MQKTVPLDYYMEEVRQIYLCQSNFWEVIEYRVFCFITISKFCWFLCFWKLLYFKFYLLLFQSFKGILSNTPLFFLAFIHLFIYLCIYLLHSFDSHLIGSMLFHVTARSGRTFHTAFDVFIV